MEVTSMRNIHPEEYDKFWSNYVEPTKSEKIKTARAVREFILNRDWYSLRIYGKFSDKNTKDKREYRADQYTEYIYDNRNDTYILRYGSLKGNCCPYCGSPEHTKKDCQYEKPQHIPWNILDTDITNFCKVKYVEADYIFYNHYWFELLGSKSHRTEPKIAIMLDKEIIPKIPVSCISRTENYIFNFSDFVVNNDLYITNSNGKRKLIFDKVKLERPMLDWHKEAPEQRNIDLAVREFLYKLDIWSDWYDPHKENYHYS